MKNIKVLFLTMILLVAILLLPCSANAAVGEIFINDGVEYKVLTEAGNTGTVQITDYDNNKAQLIIPEIITYDSKQYTVVDIANNAFSGCDTLTNIELPDSITGIGDSAFSNCTSLTSIIIPNSVKAIPYNCFSGSTSLEYVKLPDSLECIRQSSFNDCSFKSLVIPSTVTSIEYNAFGGCSLLEKIIIPNSVTGIEYNAFGGANSLTIYGYTGSYAEEYANNERRTFVTLNNSIYDIINHFTNITSDGVAFVESGTQNYTATLKAGFASTLPSEITIQMGDNILTAGTDYTYNNTTGEVKITKEITGDVKITAQAVNTRKSVNNVLTKVQSNGLDEVYPAEGNYVAMLIPDIDYKLPDVFPVLTDDDYTFMGWFTDKEYTERFSFKTFPESDVKLYAKWIKKGSFEQTFEGYYYENDHLNSDEADERTGLWIMTKLAQKHSLTKSDYTFPIPKAMYNSRPPLKPKILTE